MRHRRVELGTVVAERKYDWRRGRNAGTLTVRIGAPQRDKLPRGDWFCPVQFIGAPRGFGLMTTVRPIPGVDQLQALTLALRFVEITLAHVAPALSLTWLGSSDLGLSNLAADV